MKTSLAAVAVVMFVALAACAPSEVLARNYDQSCAKDDDCVQVSELHTKGSSCVVGCEAVAINKKDKAQYDEDRRDEERSCGSMASPFCDVTGTPKCVEARCTVVTSR